MKKYLPSVLMICFFLLSEKALSQDIVDNTFTGWWRVETLRETGDLGYLRCAALQQEDQGFLLAADGTILLKKYTEEGKPMDFKGDWWSLNLGHFSLQYYDSTVSRQVIERFEYISDKDREHITRTDYEETFRTEGSRFAGTYWKEAENEQGNPVYEQCTALENNVNGIFLSPEGESTRRLPRKKNKCGDADGIWWSGDEDNSFDIQYFDPSKKLIVIEGFEILDGLPFKIVRTRYEELKE